MQQDLLKKCIELRHELHRNAELSEKEEKTLEILKSFIKNHTDFEIVDRKGYFYAVHKCGMGYKNIAFRADIDALPIKESMNIEYNSLHKGVSHKCGHDGHSAVMAGLSAVCKEIKDKNLYFLFQPSEEIGRGARKIVEDKFIEDNSIDEIYAFHNIPGEKAGNVLLKKGIFACTSKGIIINLKGTPSHAAYPEFGINPSYGAAELITFLQGVTKLPIYKAMVLCTIINVDIGEAAFGTSASSGSVMITARAEEEEDLSKMESKIKEEVKKICSRYKMDYSIEYCDEFPETRNNEECLKKLEKVCRENNFEFKELSHPFRWSEDFGYYTKETAGAIIGIGAGENHSQLHTSDYDFPDEIIERAVDVFYSIIK